MALSPPPSVVLLRQRYTLPTRRNSPALEEAKELLTTLRDWTGRLEPAIEITRKALQPAEPSVIGVLSNFIREFAAIDLHDGVCGKTPKEIHQVKTTLHIVYGLLGAILPYLYHDKAGAA